MKRTKQAKSTKTAQLASIQYKTAAQRRGEGDSIHIRVSPAGKGVHNLISKIHTRNQASWGRGREGQQAAKKDSLGKERKKGFNALAGFHPLGKEPVTLSPKRRESGGALTSGDIMSGGTKCPET